MKQQIKFLTLFCLFTIAFACKKKEVVILPFCETCEFDCVDLLNDTPLTNDCLDNYDCTFTVHENSKLDYSNNNFDPVKSGNKRVFKMFSDTEGSAMIADDEFTNILTFQVEANLESFEIGNDELEAVNLRFINLCFCSEVEFKKASLGCIQGQKIDDQFWQIQVNADFEYATFTRTVAVDAVFEVL